MTDYLDKDPEAGREKIARQRVRAKLGFFRHFITYIIVVVFLFVVNNMTWGGYQWWIWVALGWGIGVVSHFFSAFLFQGSSFEEKLYRKELENLRDK